MNAEARVEEIYREILTRAPEHDVQPSLDRVSAVCELLGEPQRAYRTIHLTGTNGKTSTARMIEGLASSMGLRTGRFTSPHLHTVRERIAIDGAPIGPERFIAAWEDVEPYVAMVDARSRAEGGPAMSFFEVFTVMAFAAFADAPVDLAVIEVGMGGRWDATNVVDGDIAVLTPVSLDHQRWLGSTLREIAGEKAGIIKAGSVVVSAEQREEVSGIFAVAAATAGARLLEEGRDFAVAQREMAVGGQVMTLRTPAATYTEIPLSLHGAHQAHNALLALVAAEAFFGGGALPGDVVEEAFVRTRSPGRLEVVRTSPTILVDAGHNPAGMVAVREAVEEAFAFDRLVGVVACMADKDAETMLAELEPLLDEVVVTRMNSSRAMDVGDLYEIARDVFDPSRAHLAPSLADAIDRAAGLAEVGDGPAGTTGVLVIGSVVLAAEARALLGRTEA